MTSEDATAPRPPLTVFRSGSLAVRGHLGRNDTTCFVVFEPMGDDLSLDRVAFGEGFFATTGYDALHVLSAHNNWYQDADLPAALDAVRDIARTYARVITYGSSMGGYAALRFGGSVGAHVAIAISPQYSVLESKLVFEPRWRRHRRALVHRIEGPDDRLPAVADAYLFYDSRSLDRFHAAAIVAEMPAIAAVPIPYGGHPVGPTLAELGLMSSTIVAAAAGRLDVAALCSAIRRGRHRSGLTLLTLARRQPPHRLRLKARLAERASRAVPGEPIYASYAGLVLECLGHREDALRYHRAATERLGLGTCELRLARFLWRGAAFAEARDAARRARALLPRDGAPVEIVALADAVAGRADAAASVLADHPRWAARPGLQALLRRLAWTRALRTPLAGIIARRIALALAGRTVLGPTNARQELASADWD